MPRFRTFTITGAGFAVMLASLSGCSGTAPTKALANQATSSQAGGEDADIRTERAKLSPEDRALVEAQEWCVVSSDERLGSMGPPVKVMVKGQPVFLCCKGCERKALVDPDMTLAKVEELMARKKAEQPAK